MDRASDEVLSAIDRRGLGDPGEGVEGARSARKDFRAQDEAARKSANVTMRIIGSSGEASKPNRR